MCWHIVETGDGSTALDGELVAHAFYKAHRGSHKWCNTPRPANPNDIVDQMAVKKAEARIAEFRAGQTFDRYGDRA